MSERPHVDAANKSLLAKHLTQDVWNQLEGTVDAMGFPFESAIASGLTHTDSSVGVYAGSVDSYHAFSPLFGPVIASYHGRSQHRPDSTAAPVPSLTDAAKSAVRSTRIRVARNLAGFPLGPAIEPEQRRQVEQLAVDAMHALPAHFSGTYRSLESMDEAARRKLVEAHLLFKEGDRFMETAGFNRDWPHGRGMFQNADNTVLVWVNEEDHLRVISMDFGGDVNAIFERLQTVLAALSNQLPFAVDDELGFISSCPSNLGTGLRASVHVYLPNLSDEQRTAIAGEHHVQVRGVDGEHSESVGGVYDVSNRRRLGFSEVQLVTDMVRGVQALVDADRDAR